jgi:hypothetical protein
MKALPGKALRRSSRARKKGSPAAEWLREAIKSTPPAIEPRHEVSPSVKPFLVYQGRFKLHQGGRVVGLRGKIALHWSPGPELRFEGAASVRNKDLDLNAAELRTTAHGIRGRVLVLRMRHVDSSRVRYTGIFNRLALLGQRRDARAIEFQLVNFPEYIGRPVRFGPENKPLFTSSRLTLRTHGWRVDLDQVPKCSDRLTEVRARGGCITTHAGVIRRTSERPITFDQAEQFIACLHFYLSFMAGQWTGPILSAGLGSRSRRPLWETMGSWKVTPGRKPRSWFPDYSPLGVENLLGSFRHLWLDPLWSRALRTLVSWYVQANAESGSTEAAIVAAFVPLELLAWLIVVEHGGHMSARKFNALNTAERLEQLLRYSGVPLAISKDFGNLRASALAKKEGSGPRTLTAIRNALVHPRRQKRVLLAKVDPITLFEIKELALSYVELSLLRTLGYSGMYARRVFAGWRGDHLEKVPWA